NDQHDGYAAHGVRSESRGPLRETGEGAEHAAAVGDAAGGKAVQGRRRPEFGRDALRPGPVAAGPDADGNVLGQPAGAIAETVELRRGGQSMRRASARIVVHGERFSHRGLLPAGANNPPTEHPKPTVKKNTSPCLPRPPQTNSFPVKILVARV